LSKIFKEVNTHRATTEEEIKKMITLFRGKVKRSFSKNTDYLLTGKSAKA
jgi:NAD-dependent DNA ligase